MSDTARRLTAEALGTAMLLAVVVGSGIMGDRLSGGNDAIALLANSLATGAGLVVLITVFGPVSGAHFNPVVSLVFALRGELGLGLLIATIAAQTAGGIAGVVLAHAMFDLPLLEAGTKVRASSGLYVAEVAATFTLVLTILGTLRARPDFVPIAVGLVITSAYWFTASTSFANPAVTIARAFTTTFAGIAPGSVPAFMAAQLAGGLLGLVVAGYLFGRNAPAEGRP